jgi:hypothetical protein
MTDSSLTETEKQILKWDDPKDTSDTCDLIHRHFEECESKFTNWTEIAIEGARLYGLMFEEKVEDWSPVDGVLSGIAAAAYNLAIAKVAKQLGVTKLAVERALETERPGDADGFVRECKKAKQTPGPS